MVHKRSQSNYLCNKFQKNSGEHSTQRYQMYTQWKWVLLILQSDILIEAHAFKIQLKQQQFDVNSSRYFIYYEGFFCAGKRAKHPRTDTHTHIHIYEYVYNMRIS